MSRVLPNGDVVDDRDDNFINFTTRLNTAFNRYGGRRPENWVQENVVDGIMRLGGSGRTPPGTPRSYTNANGNGANSNSRGRLEKPLLNDQGDPSIASSSSFTYTSSSSSYNLKSNRRYTTPYWKTFLEFIVVRLT